jgi:2-oxoglutarate dehydrogenase E2 component (dihydrolipoamide succinyltransferase)
MPTVDIKIPPLGESISSGILASWHVKDGDVVKKDQPLFELETDKITSEGLAEAAGRITLKVSPGTEVKIGEVVASIDTSVAEAKSDDTGSKESSEKTEARPKDKEAKEKPSPEPASDKKAPPAKESPKSDAVSPAVRRIAAETGIDPGSVTGSGKGGRVTKGDMLAATKPADVAKAVTEAPASALPSTPPVVTPSSGERRTRRKMSKLRQTIANRLVSAQHEAAMLTTFNEVDMSAVMDLRKRYQDDFTKKYGVKLGFMSFFTKAVVHALREVPAVNAQIDGDEIVQNHYYDISMAVSTDKGLVVPVVRDCDQLDMAGIEKAIGDVAKRARDGKLTLPDFEGGCFTITNGGIFGSMLSTPIINAPQSAILGLHAINERPVALNGQVVIRPMMYLALSYDHRIVDGKEAVTFLVKVKQAIEDPARLLIGA